jgi:hypothetical protein
VDAALGLETERLGMLDTGEGEFLGHGVIGASKAEGEEVAQAAGQPARELALHLLVEGLHLHRYLAP